MAVLFNYMYRDASNYKSVGEVIGCAVKPLDSSMGI
jgi:hypothetical protein